jgi:hypothetical protein
MDEVQRGAAQEVNTADRTRDLKHGVYHPPTGGHRFGLVKMRKSKLPVAAGRYM